MTAGSPHRRRTLLLALAVVLAATYTAEAVRRYGTGAAPGAGLVQPLPTFLVWEDGAYYRAAVRSMLFDRDLDLRNNFEELGNDPQMSVGLGRHGEWYPKHPILLPLLALPFYAAASDKGLLAFNIVQLTVLGLLIAVCARRHASDETAAAVAILYGFSTLLRPMAYHFSPDVLAAALFLGGYAALVSNRALAAGLLVGLAVWAKLPNLVLLPIAGAYAFAVNGRTGAARFAIGAAGPLLVVAALNAWMFGSPLVTGYDVVIQKIVDGAPVLMPSHRTFFDLPLREGLAAQMTDRRLGLLVSAPILVFGVAGMRTLWRRDRSEAIMIAALAAVQIGFFARYRFWNVSNVGHRFLIVTIALSAVPAAALAGRLLDGTRRTHARA